MYLRLQTYTEFNTLWTGSELFGFILRLHLLCASFLQVGAINLYEIMYLGMNSWLGSQYV